MAVRGAPVPPAFYERDPAVVAPQLLGRVLVHGATAGRIVEVEAYRGLDDPASHAFRGPTERAAIMFDRPGRLYVYLSYGVHWCANVVGHAGAVLVRALEPLTGIDAMRERRGVRRDVDLANGPGKLCAALGIDAGHLGTDLTSPRSAVRIIDDGAVPPPTPLVGPRVGISKAVEAPLRFSVPGSPYRSRPW